MGFTASGTTSSPEGKLQPRNSLTGPYAGIRPKERRARAIAALEAVGLGARLDHMPSEMSGGQQQRVAVARAIVTNPSMILADEPTGNLDTAAAEDVMAIFSRLNAGGRTVVLITHEADIAEFAKRVIRLRDGEIIEDRRQAPVDGPPPRVAESSTIRTAGAIS